MCTRSSALRLIQSSFLFYYLGLSLLSLPLAFSLWGADGEVAIELPPMKTPAQKLAALIEIRHRIPNLFSDAARYDIDLMRLLDDEEKLLAQLKTNPVYLEEFKKKTFHQITVVPPAEGIEVNEVRIKASAVEEWRNSIYRSLDELQKAYPREKPIDALLKEVKRREQELTELEVKAKKPGDLIGLFSQTKKNQVVFNQVTRETGKKGVHLLAELLKREDSFPDRIEQDEKRREELKKEMRHTVEADHVSEKLQELAILFGSTPGRMVSRNWDEVKEDVQRLTTEDLLHISDREDVLKPMIEKEFPISLSESHKARLLDQVVNRLLNYTQQRESTIEKVTSAVRLTQVPPIIGIFRGCTGGDCSSQNSFPYPNDPNEQVYLIQNHKGDLKGYLSATRVIAGGKPSLYAITVSGQHVSAGETELILRGLEAKKHELGVEQIVLPNSNNINSLLNFPAPRGIYEKYTNNRTVVGLHYRDDKIRSSIEQFESQYNRGKYDHAQNNSAGVVLEFKDQNSKRLHVTEEQLQVEPFKPKELSQVPVSDVLEFLIELRHTHRWKIEKEIQEIPEVKSKISKEKFEEFISVLTHCESHGTVLTVEDWKSRLTQLAKELGWTPQGDADFSRGRSHLLRPGQLECEDAYEPKHCESTAKMIVEGFPDLEDFFRFHMPESYEAYRGNLLRTEAFKKVLRDYTETLKVADVSKRTLSIEWIKKLKPTDPSVHQALARVAKTDADNGVRKKAILALQEIKSHDPSVLKTLVEVMKVDADKEVRQKAILALQEIESRDPSVHQALAEVMNSDPDMLLRVMAARALGLAKPREPSLSQFFVEVMKTGGDGTVRYIAANSLEIIMPSDPSVHHALVEVMKTDADNSVRSQAARALEAIKSRDPSVHQALVEVMKTDKSSYVRQAAAEALKKIKPSEPSVHHALVEVMKTDADNSVRSQAARALGEMKSRDPSVHQALVEVMKTDENSLTRQAAVEALEEIKPSEPTVHHALVEVMKSDREGGGHVRLAAARALGAIESADPSIHQELAEVMKTDKSSYIREAAAEALGVVKPNDPSVHRLLIAAARDTNRNFSFRAAAALALLAQRHHQVLAKEDEVLVIQKLIRGMSMPSDGQDKVINLMFKLKPRDGVVQEALLKRIARTSLDQLNKLRDRSPSDAIYLNSLVLKMLNHSDREIRMKGAEILREWDKFGYLSNDQANNHHFEKLRNYFNDPIGASYCEKPFQEIVPTVEYEGILRALFQSSFGK